MRRAYQNDVGLKTSSYVDTFHTKLLPGKFKRRSQKRQSLVVFDVIFLKS